MREKVCPLGDLGEQMKLEQNIQDKIKQWSAPPYDNASILEIEKLSAAQNEAELRDRFYRGLSFGTGGLRGVIGAGTNRMNIYTVGMATQGLANYMLKNSREGSIVIVRDSRHMSLEFARRTAEVMAGNNIKVHFFEDIMPTPICSYAIRKLGATAGVVITASHNPREYNGYKVYWEDGGQIVPPRDADIIHEVSQVEDISTIKAVDFDEGRKSGLIALAGDEITQAYFTELAPYTSPTADPSSLKIVFTPIHGSGYRIIPKLFKHFGFTSLVVVPGQEEPDGNFPTVASPNPEEPAALAMAIEEGKKTGASIVLATDPDADRMGVAVREADGSYRLINGNQIGTLLEAYILERQKEENALPADGCIIKTIVTTDLQKRIADAYGCRAEEVLTGFKWIADRMKEYDNQNKGTFIFGGEESYGYLALPFVRDKDAVSSCYFFAEMALWLQNRGSTVTAFLDELYLTHGLFLDSLKSLTLKGIDGLDKIQGIMKFFREDPPEEIDGRKILLIKDFQSQSSLVPATGERTVMDTLPSSNVLQYDIEGGGRVTMRPSGTEPKIKFYFSLHTDDVEDDLEQAKNKLSSQLEQLETALLTMVEKI